MVDISQFMQHLSPGFCDDVLLSFGVRAYDVAVGDQEIAVLLKRYVVKVGPLHDPCLTHHRRSRHD